MIQKVRTLIAVSLVTLFLFGCASNPDHSIKRSHGDIESCGSEDNCAGGPTRVVQRAIDTIVLANFPERAGLYKARMWKDSGQNFALTSINPEIHISTTLYMALSWNELVAVMAHELAHQEENHPQISAGVNSTIWLADIASWFILPWLIFSPADELAKAAFSRHVEMEADILAVQYLENAGYSQADYLSLLERIAGMEGGTGCRVWCTHPHIDDRIQAVKERRNVLYVETNKKNLVAE